MSPPNPTQDCPIDFPLVILESPYAGEVDLNIRYARGCMRDCLKRGEAPYASHLLYTQEFVLDDNDPEERSLGIRAGMAWGAMASKTVVYVDRGISGGMRYGIGKAASMGRPVEYRSVHYQDAEVVAIDKKTSQGIGGPSITTTDLYVHLKNLHPEIKKAWPWIPETAMIPLA